MADRRLTPKRGKSSAAGAAFLVAALFALPVLAASTLHDPADKATLDVPDHLLAPGAAAAILEAFRTDPLTDMAKREKDKPESEPVMETRLPGVSDEDQSRFKKRMYRRDI
ncbi:MAG: hypothetical protein IIB75_07590 [Proteobacteria bacterium]|nr:hypothetical protein [Pseudomonadota bacterium]